MFGKHDPVCGAKVHNNSEYSLDYEGKKYYFDGQACMATFKENPDRFIKRSKGFLDRLGKENKDVPKCCHGMKH